ncbi:MAG: adenylate/guanylate cyclase domain-containing protein [Candidatus Aminicenantes bacterium]|nr:adenylate/guanylate cyclase domain-containing protein [Candidatus Aminicenantes bacterium]
MPNPKTKSSARKKALRGLAVGLGVFAITFLLGLLKVFQPLEWKSWDARVQLLADPPRASTDIVLLAIDQYSLDVYEKEQGLGWPWPRQIYAPVLDFLKAGGAKAVFFDLILSEASTYGIDDDRLFAEAMTRTGNVFLPVFLSAEEREAEAGETRLLERSALDRSHVPGPAVHALKSVSLPVDVLAAAAVKMGNVQFVPDGDSIYRRLPLVFSYGDRLLPALPLAMAEFISERVDLHKVPLDRSGNMILHFFGPDLTYRTYSIGAIINSQARIEEGLEPQVQPREFVGKTVIVGTKAAGLLDFRPTPFGGVYPGMEILATAIDNIVHGGAIREAPVAVTWVSVLFFALLAGIGTTMLKKIGHLAVLGLALPTVAWAGSLLAARAGLWVEFVAPAVAGVAAFIAASLLNYGIEGRQRRFIKSAFRYYLSPQVIDRVLDNPSLLRLGGERREITAFFSDVAGFTSISEGLSPEDLVGLLNAYLSEMTDIILDLGGTLDKYEGDAIIAFWNAPIDQPDHALRACRAALRCQRRLAERREDFLRRYGHEVHMRIGVNSGPAVVGNMGSERRFDYTAMGDTMNLASRLEGAGKVYGVSTLVGEETERRVRDEILAREVDIIRVVGKKQPVRVFELLGEKGAVPAEELEKAARFGRALEAYRARRFSEAAALFEALAGDPVAAVYAGRARQSAASPPPCDWDGVCELDKK